MIAYWGCNREAGHYLWRDNEDRIRGNEAERLGLPTAGQLDGTRLFLPHPETPGDGLITYLPALNVTVLAWWGNPFDKRGGTNSAVIVGGNVQSIDAIWDAFSARFSRLSMSLAKPILFRRGTP